jgi:hypothetical protein
MTKPILPNRLLIANTPAQTAAIKTALDETAALIVADFEITVNSWDHGVSFDLQSPSPYLRTITTGDGIYTMLNAGTKAHAIRPRRAKRLSFSGPFRPKTLPKTIFSGPGYIGGIVFYPMRVRHPGTKARKWDETIAKKWRKPFAQMVQQRINAAVK